MIKCPKCGTMNDSKSKFCVHCGHPLHAKAAKTAEQPKQPEQIKCPNCGKMNSAGAKFCRFCGYNFITKKMPQQNDNQQNTTSRNTNDNMYNNYQRRPRGNYTMPNYQRQWKQASQSLNGVANYSSNFFKWLSDSLSHPLKTHHAHPYFGLTTFLLIAVVSWFAEIIANNSSKISADMEDLLGFLPIKDFYNNVNNIQSVPCELVLLIIGVIAYWIIGYVANSMTHTHKENPFAFANRLASANIVTLGITVLMIVAALLDKESIIWVLIIAYHYFSAAALVSTTVTGSSKNDAESFYVAGACYVVYMIVIGLFATIASVMLA